MSKNGPIRVKLELFLKTSVRRVEMRLLPPDYKYDHRFNLLKNILGCVTKV